MLLNVLRVGCFAVRTVIALLVLDYSSGKLASLGCMAMEGAALVVARACITFGVELYVLWDAPEAVVDIHPAYGIHLRLLEYVGAPESARLLSRTPEYWLHHMGCEKTLAAALQLQDDAGLIMSNIQVLGQFVTSPNRMSSEVMRVAFDREPFPSDDVQYVTPSHRIRRVAHYMTAMCLWHPPSTQGVHGLLPSSSCNACMSCLDCFPDLPK